MKTNKQTNVLTQKETSYVVAPELSKFHSSAIKSFLVTRDDYCPIRSVVFLPKPVFQIVPTSCH